MSHIIFVSHALKIEGLQSQKVLGRLNGYSNARNRILGVESKIIVPARLNSLASSEDVLATYADLKILPQANSVARTLTFLVRQVRKYSILSPNSILLIAGDPWLDALTVTAVKKILWWVPISTQISVHGDLICQENSVLKKWIKRICLPILLNNTDSVRVVSKHLRKKLINELGVARSKVFISPVPIELKYPINPKQNSKRLIGLVGRLHYERGLDEFIEIVSKLEKSSDEFKYLIVGDGPNRASFLNQLSSIVGSERVDYRGYLDEIGMATVWNDCKILLNVAPAEGYGLALRESLLNGTFVIARNNEGTREALSELHYGMHIYTDIDEAVVLVKTLMKENFSVSEVEKMQQLVIQSNVASVKNLINSWQGICQLTDDTQDSS